MRFACFALALLGCASTPRPVPPPAHHTYAVPADVGRLVVDEDAFAGLAGPLRADIEAQLASGALQDPAKKEHEFTLAILDALDERWDAAEAGLARLMAREAQPAGKLMLGLTIRIWAEAVRLGASGGGKERDSFRAAAEQKIAPLPLDVVREQLEVLQGMAKSFNPDFCRDLVEEHVGPHAASGSIGFEDAQAVVFQRWAVKRLYPVGDLLDAVLTEKLK